MATFTIPTTPAGQIYVSAGNGGSTAWSNTIHPTTQFGSINGKPIMEIPNSDNPTVKITGRIEWNGEDLNERLKRIETMLSIPTRDVIMEDKYSKLKKINDEYNKALAEYKTWETLKESK